MYNRIACHNIIILLLGFWKIAIKLVKVYMEKYFYGVIEMDKYV